MPTVSNKTLLISVVILAAIVVPLVAWETSYLLNLWKAGQ